MKKIIATFVVGAMLFQQATFAALSDVDVGPMNEYLKGVYDTYPVLEKYCGAYEPMDTLGDSDVSDAGSELDDFAGCGKYSKQIKNLIKKMKRDVDSRQAVLDRLLSDAISNGEILSEEEAVDYVFSDYEELADKKIAQQKSQRTRLEKQKKLTEAKDIQTAFSIFMWESIGSIFTEMHGYAIDNMEEFLAEVDNEQTQDPVQDVPRQPRPAPVQPANPEKSKLGTAMTWAVLKDSQNGIVEVGADNTTNAYVGDTPISQSLPLLCINRTADTKEVPKNLSIDFYNGWSEGKVALSKSYAGSQITSHAVANKLCAGDLGDGREFAEFHHKGGGLRGGRHRYAYGDLTSSAGRFWVGIDDQGSNPRGSGW